MKSYILEATERRGIGGEFVGIARTIAHKFDVPVEWLLAALSWETGRYHAYNPDKLWDNVIHDWIDPADYHGSTPVDLLCWAHNKKDWGFGLIGFTPLPPYPTGAQMPDDLDIRAKLRMTPVEQLKKYVEDYFRTRIARFSIPTPFATIEDFYCVVYAPGMSGKPDSYSVTWQGTSYNKGTQMDIFRGRLREYDYPKKANDASGTDDNPSDSMAEGPWDMPDFMKWTPGRRRVQTTAIGVNVRSSPGMRFPVVRTVMVVGARFACLDVVTGDSVNGNTDWFKVGPSEFISGTLIAVAD
jgi:hypothetical protein